MNINFVSNKIKSLVGHPIYRIMSASVAEKANTNERTYKRTYVQSAADLVNENQSASESLTTHAKHSFSVITIEGVLIQGKMICSNKTMVHETGYSSQMNLWKVLDSEAIAILFLCNCVYGTIATDFLSLSEVSLF